MPTYEYECKSCSYNFEVFQSMSDPPLKECPECGKEVRRLILGGSGVIFKGSGFYVTDKGRSERSSPKKAGASSSCAQCPSGGEAGKCPVSSSAAQAEQKTQTESKTA